MAPTFTYPHRDIDQPTKLVPLLGSFWDGIYDDASFVQAYAYWRAQLESQSEQNLRESVAVLSRFSAPRWHTERWQSLIIRESELQQESLWRPRYGDAGLTHTTLPAELQYGDSGPGRCFCAALPSTIREIPWIFNRLTSPSTTWTSGVDYAIDAVRQVVRFRQDPFDSGFSTRPVYADGVVVDREVVLWLYQAGFERDFLTDHHAYPLGLALSSAESSAAAVNAIWDAVVEGSTLAAAAALLSAVADCPAAAGDETVQHVLADAYGVLIITDRRVYRFAATATPLVAVGDSLSLGQPLVDVWQLWELHDGRPPAELAALTVPRELLGVDATAGLTFRNADEPLVVETVDGRTKVSFALGGWPNDAELFWDVVHERGVAANQTLASLLDLRPTVASEPSAGTLPATVNPLTFLTANVLRGNAAVAQLKPTKFGPQSLSLALLAQLRRILPPHTTLLLLLQLEADDEPITMDGAGSETDAGYEETASPLEFAGSPAESITTGNVAETSRLYYVDGLCVSAL